MAQRGAIILVTTVIPAYNAELYIAKAIDSALAQGIPQQIIVVDDGSSDRTAELVRGYGSKVELVLQHHRGVSATRNRAISNARGDYVAFLDADDIWLPGKLSAQLALFAADSSLGTVICDEAHVSLSGEVIRTSFHATLRCHKQLPVKPARMDQAVTCLVRESLVPTSSVLTRRDVLTQAGHFDTDLSICEDRDLWLRLAFIAPFGLVPEVKLHYLTGRPGSLSAMASRPDWAVALRKVLIRHRSMIDAKVTSEGEDAPKLLAEVFGSLGQVLWHANRLDLAEPNLWDAIRLGAIGHIPKWFVARTSRHLFLKRASRA